MSDDGRPMSEASDFPRRLVLGGKSGGPIEIYADDHEFIGRGKIASAPPPGGMAYRRADTVVDRDVAEKMAEALRDQQNILEDIQGSIGLTAEERRTFPDRAVAAQNRADAALAAYEEARSENGIPRTLDPNAPHPGKEDDGTCT